MNDNTIEKTESSTYLVLQELPINWKWMIFLGILMLILGKVGLIASGFLTLTSILMFGGFIFAGGIIQMIHAIVTKEKEWSGKIQHILITLLYIAAGLIYCKRHDWKWLLPAFSGLLNLILTVIIVITLPESAMWLIGLLIAIEMLFSGWFLLILGLRVKNLDNNGV